MIADGKLQTRALRRLAMRPAELDHAVRMQDGDDISDVGSGRLEPSGQLVLTLKPDQQTATKADIARLTAQLASIQTMLSQLAADSG